MPHVYKRREEECRLKIHCCQTLIKWKLSTKTSRELLICRPASQLDDRQQTTKVLSFFFFWGRMPGHWHLNLWAEGSWQTPVAVCSYWGSILVRRLGGVPPTLTCPTVPGVSLSLNVVGVGGKRLLGLGGRKDRINEGDTRCPGVGWHGVPCLCLGLEGLLWLHLWITVLVCFVVLDYILIPSVSIFRNHTLFCRVPRGEPTPFKLTMSPT